MTPQEKAYIRSQLKLRENKLAGTYEVYTTKIGGRHLEFTWITISKEMYNWYVRTFDCHVDVPLTMDTVDADCGAIRN